MEVYRGALLEGFFIDGMSAGLEEWIDTERARLNWKAFLASRELADEAERSGNGIAAAQWARSAVALAPDNEIAVRRLIEILDAFGDRAGALRVADDFARRLSAEFGTEPAAETQALIAAVRARGPTPSAASTALAIGPSAGESTTPAFPAAVAGGAQAPVPERTPGRRGSHQGAGHSARAPHGRPTRSVLLLAAAFIIAVGGGAMLVTASGHTAPPDRALAEAVTPPITIASPAARQLYNEALARYTAGDARESVRLFSAALADDSTCAMCAYYAALAYGGFDDIASFRMLQLATRLASRVSEPEQLLIRYKWADVTNSVSRGAVAESLVTRYPNWPAAQTAAAEAAEMDANWLVAAEHYRRAIASEPVLDSASGDRCPVCVAEYELYDTYEAADSLQAALRVAQAWVRRQPRSREGWLHLSHALAESGRYAEARAAMDTSTRYALETNDDAIEHAQIEIRAGNFADADRLLTSLTETGNANSRFKAMWFLIISLRAQGRLDEAMHIIEGPMRRAAVASTQGGGDIVSAEGQVLLELDEPRRAAAVFATAASPVDSFSLSQVGRAARQHAWVLTHVGSAMAAAGDTTALERLADTVQAWGNKSGFERDRRLHHYVRGLLWMARDRPDSAVIAFRQAITSETQGFSRLQLELARTLLQLGRAKDAIPVLQHPLRGTLEGGNFYATRTELQEELAHAFDAAGERDSAAVYYRAVIEAWHAADPRFQPRVAAARARLAADIQTLAGRH